MIAISKLAGSADDPSSINDPAAVASVPLASGRFCNVAWAIERILGIDCEGIGSGSGNGEVDEKTEREEYSRSSIHWTSVPFSHLKKRKSDSEPIHPIGYPGHSRKGQVLLS